MTIWALIPLITCLSYIALVILTLASPGRRINRVFAFYLGMAATWSFTSFMLHLNAFPQHSLFWNEILASAMIGTLATYYHFLRAYTNKPAGAWTYIGYTVAIVWAALSLTGNTVQYAYVVDGVLYHSLGASLYFIGAVSLTFIGGGLVLLIKKYRSSSDSIERNRTMYLMAGWSILMLFAYSNLIPALDGLPLDHVGSLANALIITYAIRRYPLVDIRLVLRKGLVYSSLTILLTSIYLLLLFVLQLFLQDWTDHNRVTLVAGFTLLVALLLNPLKNFIQKWIDRLFYRETYDYRQMLLTFSSKISNVLDLNELAQSILDPIVNSMHVKHATLLFPELEGVVFVTRFSHNSDNSKPPPNLRLSYDNPIVTWLTEEGKALRREFIDISPQFKGMWEVERIAIDALGETLFCPIRGKGKLTGILVLGEKQSETRYSDDEVNLIMTMANEASIAVDNARMLDSLRNQQLQVEQLLTQLVLAQEEERQRISIDLHDSVAQWLIAASYRAQTATHFLPENGNEVIRKELAEMEDTISRSVKELRRVVVGLRPPALDELGLTHALQQCLEELKTDGMKCRFTQAGTSRRLSSLMEITAYRVVQEATNNIRKHADATEVSLYLQFREDRLIIDIQDDGKGFDLSKTLDSAVAVGHIGLLGMKQRAEMLGGNFRVRTTEGNGTTISLNLPTQSQKEER